MLRRLYDWTLAKAAHPHAPWWLALVLPLPLLYLMVEASLAVYRTLQFVITFAIT